MKTYFKYGVLMLIVLLIVAMAIWQGMLVHVRATNTSYYVDCSAPTNGNGSQSSPWNSLTSPNGATFGAGDQLLFKRGTTCTGTLTPHGSGASGNPFVVGAYGTGNKPIIAGNGATDAIYVYNQQYLEIRDLEVTNDSATASNRRGIWIVLSEYGVGNYYRLTNLTVHNVKGADQKNGGGSAGIMLEVQCGTKCTTQTKFNDVLIEGNTVYTVDRSGIMMWSQWSARPELSYNGAPWFPATNVVIRNNTVYDTGGDGIIPHMSAGALVEYNLVHDFNARSAGANVGMWGWDVDDLIIQSNEAYNGGPNGSVADSQGYDIDEANTGTTIQYNYSHDNGGGFVLVCDGRNSQTLDGVIRYNISQNDEHTIINIHCYPSTNTTLIYNNTLYISPNLPAGDYIIFNNNNATGNEAFYNNIFYNLCSGCIYGDSFVGLTFDYNLFYGYHPNPEPADLHKLTSDPLLVNPGSGTSRTSVDGYMLQAGSPAIGSGVLVANNGGKDYWGNPVSDTAAPNRGAYNGSGVGGPTPTPVPPTVTPGGPTPTPTNTPTPAPTNTPLPGYIGNPGFETGSMPPWTSANAYVRNSNPHSGVYAVWIPAISSTAQQVINGLTPSTGYTLKGWIKSGKVGKTICLGVKNYGGSDTCITSTTTSWVQKTINFTTGSTNTSATIYCATGDATWGECDDFELILQ